MSPERFAQIERVFDQARGLSEAQRAELLDSLCAGDASLRAEVENLLAHDAPTPQPLVERLTQVMNDDESRAAAASDAAGSDAADGVGDLSTRRHAVAKLSTGHFLDRTIGPYQVVRVIGRGGMGVVYLARDDRLHRNVAIKALPPQFLDHPARAARFMREARLLASLSHPNIATVFGLEECAVPETDCTARCLVMEFVDGNSLAHRLRTGPLPIEQALDVCRQVAAGVEAAHAEDVIHRDLKPANVMVAGDDGTAKVLDFGLARSVDPPSGTGSRPGPGTHVKTQMGAAVGTPGYMSPEQLRGELLDKRTDIFAFGCILYESLTGRVAFTGSSAADVATAVLERDPDWSLLPARTPASIRRLLARCLARDRARRLRDIGDARLELEDALDAREWTASGIVPATAATAAQNRRWRVRWALSTVAVAVLAVAITLAATRMRREKTSASASQTSALASAAAAPFQRYALGFPEGAAQSDLAHLRLAMAHDGARMIVSATDGKNQALYLRERDRDAFRKIDGTESAWIPSFSPDGQWITYFDNGVIRKRSLAGGNPARVSDVQGYWSEYSWSKDGYLSYIPYWSRGVARIHNEGGTPEFITQPDNKAGEFAHVTPVTLLDGSAILYMVWDGGTGTRIDAIDLKTRKRRTVVPDGAHPRVADTPHGPYLLWVRSGTIYAAPFDPVALQRTGPESPIADSVLFDRVLFVASYDVANDGTLAYVPGPMFVEESRLAWLKPGSTEPTSPAIEERLGFCEPNLSADGKLLSFIIKSDVFKPAVYNLDTGTLRRIVTDGDCESAAVSPDGKLLAYCSNKEGSYDVYVRELGTESERKVFKGPGDYPSAITWSTDNRRITFATTPDDSSKRDIYVIDVSVEKGEASTFVNSRGDERGPRFSPDGKWLAYASDEPGRREVFVRSFPDGKLTRQVTVDGGDWPAWEPGGSKLYFRNKGKLFAVSITTDGVAGGRPQVVHDEPFGQSNFDAPDYTVCPADGRLMLVEPSERGPKVSQIQVLLNWYNLSGIPHAAR